MKGFRPSFYNEDAKLRSIEILAWAVTLPAFTIMKAKTHFEIQLQDYRDPDHEISERLRKLLKSGMIVIADDEALNLQKSILEARERAEIEDAQRTRKPIPKVEEVQGEITLERLATIKKALVDLQNEKRGAGRPPRLYFTTQAAAKYVESRAQDLAAIAEVRAKEKKS